MPSTPGPQLPSLVLHGVGRAFGATWALRGVSFERHVPGVVGVAGHNGSGKTCLLRMVAQLLRPTQGSIEVCGLDVTGPRAADARRAVGFVPHAPLASRPATVRDNLRHAARLAGLQRAAAGQLASDAIARWELGAHANVAVGALSRGWAQRYACARADLLAPPVLLLDEPTTGLDAAAREQLEGALELWRSDRIVLIASHELRWLADVAELTIELGVEVAAPAPRVPAGAAS